MTAQRPNRAMSRTISSFGNTIGVWLLSAMPLMIPLVIILMRRLKNSEVQL